ncbi:MAG TPA: hypothetical protein PK854_08695 [Oscillospiraceae bacterium]|nr:hypothetical protein [Oscillospiraceae bacterium]HPS35330.1 hypothetical protein [Oscillospiraceae bacterium]
MMHLLVGDGIAKADNRVKGTGQFYLGCFLPDSVNVGGFAPKDVRWAAHLRAKSLPEWYENVGKFYCENRKKYDNDLLLGYCVHCITDAAFDEFFHKDIWKKAEAANLTGWDECFRFDRTVMDGLWWKEKLRPLLGKTVPEGVGKISTELADRALRYVINDHYATLPPEPPTFVTDEIIRELTIETLGKTEESLKIDFQT